MAPGSEALPAAGRDRGAVSLSSWLRQRRHFSAITDKTGRIVEFGCFDQPGLGPPAGIIGTYLPEELLATPLAHDHWPAREFEFHAGQTYCVSRAHLHAEQPNPARILWTFQPGTTVHSAAGTTGVPNQVSDFMAAMPIIVWESAPDRKGILFNRAWYEFTGRPALLETVAGWADCVHPDDITAARVAFDNAVAQRSLCTSEYRLRRHDGEFCWVLDIARARYSPAGEFAGFVGAIIDIEPAKRIESALQSAEQRSQRTEFALRDIDARLQLALGHASMAWFERNIATGLLTGSPSLWLIYGLDPRHEPLHFSDIEDRMHPADRARHPGAAAKLRAGYWDHDRTSVLSYRVRRADGSYGWVEVRYRVSLEANEGQGGVYGLVIDITANKANEIALRESEARLRLALQAANMASWHWDFNSDLVTSSDRLDELLGLSTWGPWSSESLIRQVAEPDRDGLQIALGDLRTGRKGALDREIRVVAARGDERWIEIRAEVDYSTQGVLSAAHGIAIDISNRKRIEAERMALEGQLRQAQKMEAIGQLTGGIAHDFNNILSSILGYTGLAQLKFRDSVPPKLDEYLSEIRAAGERARDMIMHMLVFSRGQSREVADADLPNLVETTIKMLRPTLPASITLQFHSEVEAARATVDPIQLQQVLINLAINARDAMAGQGHIDIRLALLDMPGSRCSSCHANFGGTYLSLSVEDTGPGIPNAVLERIFEPFYSTKPVGEGTGMGLAMAHGIVHRHGGHIRVESRSRIGTRFEILLPPGNGDSVVVTGTERTDEAAPDGGLCGEVLVVDDEPALGRYVGELLELHGIKVSVEQNPRRALSLLLESPHRFDVLITDHTMPELSGVHLAQEALAVRPGFPIILLTGYSAVVDRNQAQALGIRAYFDKPVCGDELVATVQALIRERSTLLPPGAGAEGLGLAAEALASQALHDARELR